MNRATLIGVGLVAALAVGVYLWTAPEPEPPTVSAEAARDELEVERLDTVSTPKLAVVSVRTTMLDESPESGRRFYLTLTFARESDGWRLVFDQNTRIPREA